MKDNFFAYSVKSNFHPKNQDAIFVGEYLDFYYFIVCDGVGSVDESERLSTLCVEFFKNKIKTLNTQIIVNEFQDWFFLALNELNALIKKEFEDNFLLLKSLACTLNFNVFFQNTLYTFNIGDSRTYVYNIDEKTLLQITQDQNLENYLRERNETDLSMFDEGKLRSLINYVSYKTTIEKLNFSFQQTSVKKNSYIMVCTDGFYNFFDFNNIVLDSKKTINDLVLSFINQAITNKSYDDVSLGILYVK